MINICWKLILATGLVICAAIGHANAQSNGVGIACTVGLNTNIQPCAQLPGGDGTATVLYKKAVAGIVANAALMTLPVNAYIVSVAVQNSTANAVTGGIALGTSAAGNDIYVALAVGANADVSMTDALILKRHFSTSATQQIFISTVTLWNSASVNVTVFYTILN